MELEYYNKIKSIGSVQLKGTELALVEMIDNGLIDMNTTAMELINICIDFTKTQRELYENSKVDQNYSVGNKGLTNI